MSRLDLNEYYSTEGKHTDRLQTPKQKKYFQLVPVDCRVLHCNHLFQLVFQSIWSELDLRSKWKKGMYSLSKNVLTFHCLNKLFWWSQKFCKFSAFSLKFQKFFLIAKNNFFSQYVRTISLTKYYFCIRLYYIQPFKNVLTQH